MNIKQGLAASIAALVITGCAENPPAVTTVLHCEAEMLYFESQHGSDYTIENVDDEPHRVEVWSYPSQTVFFSWDDDEAGCDLIVFEAG